MKKMVVIGHSQGGLLTKLVAVDSGTQFWDNVTSRSIDELKVSDEDRALLAALDVLRAACRSCGA